MEKKVALAEKSRKLVQGWHRQKHSRKSASHKSHDSELATSRLVTVFGGGRSNRQMRYYNTERCLGLDYRAPGEYLAVPGIHPRVLVEIGPPSGSVSGAQVLAAEVKT